MELREQIANLCSKGSRDCDYNCSTCKELAGILSSLKEEISKLEVIGDEELEKAIRFHCGDFGSDWNPNGVIAQAQLQEDKDRLLEVMK